MGERDLSLTSRSCVNGFSHDWLRLRAPFDRAARDGALAQRFAAALRRSEAGGSLRLLDLGSGTGANARSLAPLIGRNQDWLLVDNDPSMLARQAAEHLAWAAREGYAVEHDDGTVLVRADGASWRFAARRLDLARELAAVMAAVWDGVAMAAFADLVSAQWVDWLASEVARRQLALLSVLAVDGRRQWHPAAAADTIVGAAFAAHQCRDKGFGPALGGAAPGYLGARLAAVGCAVATAASDWRVGPDHRQMLTAIVAGEAAAAREAHPEKTAIVAAWSERRRAEIAAGTLSITVGHRDLLALPAA
jgi:SAM-dependent methyltransferase